MVFTNKCNARSSAAPISIQFLVEIGCCPLVSHEISNICNRSGIKLFKLADDICETDV